MPRPEPHALSVLVVDGCQDGAESLAILLRLYGHDARVACDTSAARRVVDSFSFDAAFIDMAPGSGDGLGLARSLRRRPGRRPLLVAVTGYGSADERHRCDDAGFDHFLLKPLEPAELEALLRRHADRLGLAEGAR